MKSKFVECGMYGWCIEVLWTGLNSLAHHDAKLMGFSSLLMFPIYGTAAVIGPLSEQLRNYSTFTRGLIYMSGIFAVEYVTGTWLKHFGCCPWDYSDSRWQIDGVIRLDYAPLWFLTGLFYEKRLQQ